MIQQGEKPLIRVDHVKKIYRMGDERVIALDDVTLDIHRGEIVCFLGTSGSGKSTFLNRVAGLEKPTAEKSGSAIFHPQAERRTGNAVPAEKYRFYIPGLSFDTEHDGAGKRNGTADVSRRR